MEKASCKLIVALDFPDTADALKLVEELEGTVSFYKIGLELLYSGGLDLARELIRQGNKVFIDAKLLDIGHTVERAVANIAKIGATFLTIHGTDKKTLEAARAGRGTSPLKLFAVTVLTNLDKADLQDQCIDREASEVVLHRARLAAEAGIDGVIASGLEARPIRDAFGPDLLIVTPGIRPKGSVVDDQARVTTPADAIKAGADYLVVGRPISQANDRKTAAEAIISEISNALQAN